MLLTLLLLNAGPVTFERAPEWFDSRQAERVIDRIQSKLEWDLRKTTALFHADAAEFKKSHTYGDSVVAYADKVSSSIHLGPRVTKENFEAVFGHELAHLIVAQKYKQAIPEWLEEGLANYVGRHGQVDYAWLGGQKRPPVRELVHPFQAGRDPRLHYMLSTAAVEMLAAKCSFADLLQLSVGKKLESFLATYCGISDLDGELNRYLQTQSRAKK